MLVLAITDLRRLVTTADVTAAMSVEGLLGTDDVFADDLQALRPHPGQAASAANLRKLMRDSEIRESHRTEECTRVQDAYSLRCAPQVAGGARDTIDHADARRRVGSSRRRSTTPSSRSTAASSPTATSTAPRSPTSSTSWRSWPPTWPASRERRTDRFLDQSRSNGLPPFLADDPGVDSGHMIAQYTQAALVSEMKRLAAPASVDSIPSSAMQEDHVSMGWSAARKLRRVRRRPDPGPRRRAGHRRPRHSTCARRCAGARHRRGRRGPPGDGARTRTRPVPRSGDRGGGGLRRRGRRRPRRRDRHRPARLSPSQTDHFDPRRPTWMAPDPFAPRAARP